MRKALALMLFALLVFSSLVIVGSAFAQSTQKPSIPEFTVELVNHPYDVPTTYTIDKYTGENITHAGYRVDNKSIEITVKNQPFTSDGVVLKLYYNVRYKGHYEKDWWIFFGSPDDYPVQSGLVYTVISLPLDLLDFPVRAEVDFQVQALIGTVTLIEARLWGVPNYYEFDGQASGWSETQTLTIGESQASSPKPTIPTSPSQMPDEEPELSELDVILVVAVIVAVIGAGLGLLIYLIRRK